MSPIRLIPLALLAACATADAREGLVTIDTLPGGIPLVTTAAPVDAGRWSLVHERDVQPPSGAAGELLEPQDLALRDDGTLIVGEGHPAIINVFGPDGRFQRSIGRDGEGPGEFRVTFLAVLGDTLVVQDPGTQRATSFDLRDGSTIALRTTVCCYWHPIAVDDRGRAVARMMSLGDTTAPQGQGFIRFPIGGTTAESLVVLEHPDPDDLPRWRFGDGKRMMFMMAVPMQARNHHALLPTGDFVSGWSGEYRLRVSRTGGDTLRLFTRPWTADPVTDEDRARLVESKLAEMLSNGMGLTEEQLRKTMDPAAIPATRPAFTSLWTDRAGRTWVKRSVADTANVHLDLFDAEGRWLDELQVAEPGWASADYQPLAFARDHLALLLEDDDGLPIVRIYRIVRSGE